MLVILWCIFVVPWKLAVSVSVVVSFSSFMITYTSTHFVRYVDLFCYPVPDFINTIPVIQSFEYSIATNHYVIEVVLNLETHNIWLTNNNIWVSAIFRTLGFYISEGFRYAQTAWKDSQGSLNIQVFFVWVLSSFCKCLSSIYLSTSCLDSYLF